MRVLKWMFGRINETAAGSENTLGFSPRYEDIDWKGLTFSEDQFNQVMKLDIGQWLKEMSLHKEFFLSLRHSLPLEFINIQENKMVVFLKSQNQGLPLQ